MLSNSLTQISPSECIGNSLSAINKNFSQIGTKVDSLETTLATNVSKIVAGTNITVSPSSGTGIVTINSTINNNSIVLSGVNVGTSGAGIFKEKAGQNLAFKRIVGSGTNIIVTEDSNTIKIAALGVNGTIGVVPQNLGTGIGIAVGAAGQVLPFKSLKQGTGIGITDGLNEITISANLSGKNVGTGSTVYQSASGNVLLFKTIINGTPNVRVENKANEIAIHVDESTTGLSIGEGAQLFKEKLTNGLVFRSLLSSTPNVVITERAQDVTIGVNERTTGKNVGVGTGVFLEKTGNELAFKTLKKGNNIQITDNGTEIRLDAVLEGTGGGEVNQGRNLGTGAKVYKSKDGVDLVFRTLSAGPGITINEATNVVTISAIPQVMGRGDIIGAINLNENSRSLGLYAGSKTQDGFLNFKSLSAGSNVRLQSTPTNINIQLSGVITDARNSVFGIGEGEIYKGKSESNVLEYRKIKAGPGMQIITGTNDIIVSSSIAANLDTIAASFKNKIINGKFEFWQWANKATINPTTGIVSSTVLTSLTDRDNQYPKYFADRWAFCAGNAATGGYGTQSATFYKGVASFSDIFAIPQRPNYYGRIELNDRAVGLPGVQVTTTRLMHRVENIFALAGKRLTMSFYARSNNIGSSVIKLLLNQAYNAALPQFTTDYRSNLIAVFNPTADWQKYSATFTVPALNELFMNSAWADSPNFEQAMYDSFTQFVFEVFGDRGRFFDITCVQLEEGEAASSFELRPSYIELQLCQRYFETGTSLFSQIGTMEVTNRTEIPFNVVKRIVPTILTDGRMVLFKNTGTNGSSNVSQHVVSTADVSKTHLRTKFASSGNGVLTTPNVYNWAADAEFII